MAKWALYTKYSNENRSYVMSVELNSKAEARAYFMGLKKLKAEQFDLQFEVDYMQESKDNSNKGLILG